MGFRNLTDSEVARLEAAGNRSDDWSGVMVSDDFRTEQLSGCRLSGRVLIDSGARITDSSVSGYRIGERSVVRSVTLLECRHRSPFGNGTAVETVNECGGRRVLIHDRMSAQAAYMAAMYRHRPNLVAKLDAMAVRRGEEVSSETGTVGSDCQIVGARIIREVRIGNGVTIEGASLLENGTLLDGARVGADVKARDFIAAEGSVMDNGAICEKCFIGEAATVGNGFTAANSLFFANSHCENGEAASIFAGPYTVSHHKSTLLIAGIFSFFNGGSGTNQSNHLFKGGAVHQAVHPRGCKFASNAYVMAPAAEGPFTMVMGRHVKHHDTSEMPFSYLVESNGVSMLMPAMNLRSYGTARDIAKWPQRDRRSVRRDVIDFEEFNPYLTGRVICAAESLRHMGDSQPDEQLYHYHNTFIKASMLRMGIKLYEKYIACALGQILSNGTEGRTDNTGEAYGKWVDMAGQYISKAAVERLIDDIEAERVTTPEEIDARLRRFDGERLQHERAWALAELARMLGHKPSEEEIAECIARGEEAHRSLCETVEADLQRENSADMSVGYGIDSDSEQERMEDFKRVRGL